MLDRDVLDPRRPVQQRTAVDEGLGRRGVAEVEGGACGQHDHTGGVDLIHDMRERWKVQRGAGAVQVGEAHVVEAGDHAARRLFAPLFEVGARRRKPRSERRRVGACRQAPDIGREEGEGRPCRFGGDGHAEQQFVGDHHIRAEVCDQVARIQRIGLGRAGHHRVAHRLHHGRRPDVAPVLKRIVGPAALGSVGRPPPGSEGEAGPLGGRLVRFV